jgi:hypothetical protein
MGRVRCAAHVFYLKGQAEGLELACEFGTIVGPNFGGVPKHLRNLFLDRVCHGFATLVFNQCQHAKFAKTANGTQNVYLVVTVTKIDD